MAPTLRGLGRGIARAIRRTRDVRPAPPGGPAGYYAAAVRSFIAQARIRSVVDLDCGDFRVGAAIARGVRYTGIVADAEVAARHRRSFGGRRVQFLARDVVADDLPDGDLCLAGELPGRLTNAEIRLLLLKARKYQYFIFTDRQPPFGTFIPNRDKPPGSATRLDIHSALLVQRPPFDVRLAEIFLAQPADDPIHHPDERLCSYLIRMDCQAGYLDPVYLD